MKTLLIIVACTGGPTTPVAFPSPAACEQTKASIHEQSMAASAEAKRDFEAEHPGSTMIKGPIPPLVYCVAQPD